MKKASAQRQEWISIGHGKYEELPGEKEFFEACKKSNKMVCHFFRDSTMRCKIVDKHLSALAPKHLETRFVKLSVERAPFLCERLKIRILPTIAVVINNVTKDYIKGLMTSEGWMISQLRCWSGDWRALMLSTILETS